MARFIFKKLVRDKLPQMYKDLNQTIVSRTLTDNELHMRLQDKLIEEATEIPIDSDDRSMIINELSDVYQVLDDIRAELAISIEEVEDAKQKKFAKKGGFSNGIFVEIIELYDDKWLEYYRREPEKYKEIE